MVSWCQWRIFCAGRTSKNHQLLYDDMERELGFFDRNEYQVHRVFKNVSHTPTLGIDFLGGDVGPIGALSRKSERKYSSIFYEHNGQQVILDPERIKDPSDKIEPKMLMVQVKKRRNLATTGEAWDLIDRFFDLTLFGDNA